MKELPHPLWKALHILPPWLPGLLTMLFVMLLLALPVYLWIRSRRRKAVALPPLPGKQQTSPRRSLRSLLEEIVRRAITEKNYRRGFHELAAAARQALSRRTGLEFEKMTVAEMREYLKSGRLLRAMDFLEVQQFGSREPTASELEEALAALTASLSRGGRIPLKKRRR